MILRNIMRIVMRLLKTGMSMSRWRWWWWWDGEGEGGHSLHWLMILESVGGALGDLLSSPKIPSKVSYLRRRITMLKVVLKTPSYHSELTTGKEGHDDTSTVCHHGPNMGGHTYLFGRWSLSFENLSHCPLSDWQIHYIWWENSLRILNVDPIDKWWWWWRWWWPQWL